MSKSASYCERERLKVENNTHFLPIRQDFVVGQHQRNSCAAAAVVDAAVVVVWQHLFSMGSMATE